MAFDNLQFPAGCNVNVSSLMDELTLIADQGDGYNDFIAKLTNACTPTSLDPVTMRENVWNNYPEYMQPNRFIRMYVPPVLLILGTIGNLLSFVIMARNMLKVSTYSYLAVLAIMDLLVLYIGLLRMWVGEFSVDVQHTSNWMCKLVNYLGYVSSVASVWLIIAVTIERFIAVKFPLRAPRMCNVTRARFVIVAVVLSVCLLNSHIFWTVELKYTISNTTVTSVCDAGPDHTILIKEVWPWVDAAVYSFVPFVIITILNILIVRQVLYARERRTKMQNVELTSKFLKLNQAQHKRPNESSKKLTCMLLAVSFTFLLTTLPMNLLQIFTAFQGGHGGETKQEIAKRYAQFTLARTVVELLMYVNHSVNFFLYCATGRKFRKQVKLMLCLCCNGRFNELFRKKRFPSDSTTTSYRLSRINSYSTTPKKMVIEIDRRFVMNRQ